MTDHEQRLLRDMLRIRRFEERCAELYQAEKIRGFLHLYIGEEAVAVGVINLLTPDDAIVATYREHGHALIRGLDAGCIMAEMYGKVGGCSMGRGGSMHIFDKDARFYGGNAIVGGGLPLAIGLALADKMNGLDRVTAVFFGEGAVAEGEFHESMNLAALWDLPVLFCCENNLYAMGTALDRSESQTALTLKAAAYQMRRGAGPHFLEFRTYRFRAHSMFDAELYRERDEVEAWKEHDPIDTFREQLLAADRLTEAEWAAMEDEVAEEVESAVAYAEAAEWEPVEDLERFVYSEVTA